MRRWLLAAALAAGGALGAAPAASAPANPSAGLALLQQPWQELRTPNFRAYTVGNTQVLMTIVGKMEQFRHAYGSLAGFQTVASPPILFYAFPDDKSFTPFKPLYQGKPKDTAGYFTRGELANFIAMDLERPSSLTIETIHHEYTHLLLRRNAIYWPLWLEEGMADLYSNFEVNGPAVLIGKPLRKRLNTLQREEMLPLSRLLGVKHDSPEYNTEEHSGMFYAQSWLLTHYLTMGDNANHRARFAQFNHLLRAGVEPTLAFTSAFAITLPVMERELKGYYGRGKFEPVQLKSAAPNAARQSVFFRPVGPAEMALNLGRLLLQMNRHAEARAFFEEAGRRLPAGPFGDEGMGLLYADLNKPAEAIPPLQRAIQKGSQDYVAHFELGRQRLQQTKGGGDMLRTMPDQDAAAIRTPLQKAISLMPSCAPAHYCLGMLELVQHEPEAAERHLQTAVNLEPDNCSYVLVLGDVLVRFNKADKARATLQDMANLGSHPKCQAKARELLARLPEAPGGAKKRK